MSVCGLINLRGYDQQYRWWRPTCRHRHRSWWGQHGQLQLDAWKYLARRAVSILCVVTCSPFCLSLQMLIFFISMHDLPSIDCIFPNWLIHHRIYLYPPSPLHTFPPFTKSCYTYNHCYGLYSQRKNVESIKLNYTFTGQKNYQKHLSRTSTFARLKNCASKIFKSGPRTFHSIQCPESSLLLEW